MRKGHIMRKQIRRHIYFSGRVQEVGFRFTACLLARRLSLTGWVKNLWDGRVEMEVQGTEDEIEAENLPLKEKEREFRETW